MPVQLLGEHQAAKLRALPLTYPPPGAVGERVPPGYRHLQAKARLDRRDFEAAAQDLLTWRMHDKAGLRVHASEPMARLDSVVVMHLGVGPLSVRIPCRVIDIIDEPHRKGFAYGTLPGHPESGEESFVLDRDAAGTIHFTVTAFSKPATRLARLGGPMTRTAQDWMTRRYLAALDQP